MSNQLQNIFLDVKAFSSNLDLMKEMLKTFSEEYCYVSYPYSEGSAGMGIQDYSCCAPDAPSGIEQLYLFFDLADGIEHIMDIRGHVAFDGDTAEIVVKNGELCSLGKRGRRLEGIYLKLTPEAAESYTLQYRVHQKGSSTPIEETDWVTDGQLAGSTGKSQPIDAVQIMLVKKNPFDTAFFKNACENKINKKTRKRGMLRAGKEASTENMTIPEPMSIDAKGDMSDEDYKACSLIVNVCRNMIQKTITDIAETNNIPLSEALKNTDSWIKGFVDFPFPFFNFESMQEQDYKNDEFSLAANPEVIEEIVNIDGVPSLKKAVIGALKKAGPKGEIASYSNTEKNFNYFGIVTAYEQRAISMRIIAFSMNMKETNVKSLCGGVQKTHLDSHYKTYLFTADKEMMIKMQSRVQDKLLDTIGKYLTDFIEAFYQDELIKYKNALSGAMKK